MQLQVVGVAAVQQSERAPEAEASAEGCDEPFFFLRCARSSVGGLLRRYARSSVGGLLRRDGGEARRLPPGRSDTSFSRDDDMMG